MTLQDIPVVVVDLVPMAMSLADLRRSVGLVRDGGHDDAARIGARAAWSLPGW